MADFGVPPMDSRGGTRSSYRVKVAAGVERHPGRLAPAAAAPVGVNPGESSMSAAHVVDDATSQNRIAAAIADLQNLFSAWAEHPRPLADNVHGWITAGQSDWWADAARWGEFARMVQDALPDTRGTLAHTVDGMKTYSIPTAYVGERPRQAFDLGHETAYKLVHDAVRGAGVSDRLSLINKWLASGWLAAGESGSHFRAKFLHTLTRLLLNLVQQAEDRRTGDDYEREAHRVIQAHRVDRGWVDTDLREGEHEQRFRSAALWWLNGKLAGRPIRFLPPLAAVYDDPPRHIESLEFGDVSASPTMRAESRVPASASAEPSDAETPHAPDDRPERLTTYGDHKSDPKNIGLLVNGIEKPVASIANWLFIKVMLALPAKHGQKLPANRVADEVKKLNGRKGDYAKGWAKMTAGRASDALASAGSKFKFSTSADKNGTVYVVWVYGTDGITGEDSA